MAVRILTAVIALPVFFLVLFFLPPICFTIAIVALSVVAVYELLWRSKIIKNRALMIPPSLLAVAIPLWAHGGFDGAFVLPALFLVVLTAFLIWMAQQKKVAFRDLAAVFFCGIFVSLFLSATIGIFHMPNGKFMILMPFIAAWMTDTGAYFTGVFFGKHKLCPTISPKKTIEGAIGGVLVCMISFLLYGVVLQSFFDLQVSFFALGLLGLVLSPIAEIGDLSLSLIKREYNIKDYGFIFPGHGGVLDRFDSVLFAAPATFAILQVIPMIL